MKFLGLDCLAGGPESIPLAGSGGARPQERRAALLEFETPSLEVSEHRENCRGKTCSERGSRCSSKSIPAPVCDGNMM